MSFKRKLLNLKVWRLSGWGLTVFLAVATTIQLLGVLLSAIPTGLLVTNANLFLSGTDQAIEFPRSFGNFTILILVDLMQGILTLMTWWFSYRAFESLPYYGQRFTKKKRRAMVTQWHEAAIVLIFVGLVGTLANLIQRLWLWSQVIAPHLREQSANHAELSFSAILFNDWDLLVSAPAVMVFAGLFTLLFFEKLESSESIAEYETGYETGFTSRFADGYEAGYETDYYTGEDADFFEPDYEEPPLTTGMIALQALPGSMKQMPQDLRALPWRLWKRTVDFFQNGRF